MRYSRVLTVLALVGVVGLTATLLTHGARSAQRHVPAAAQRPVPAAVTTPTLQGALQQQVQKLLASPRPIGPQVPSLGVPFGPTSCPVASGSCSGNPCVYLVQGGAQPAGLVSGSVLTAPRLPNLGGAQTCSRHALPDTLLVSGQMQPPTVSAATPVVSALAHPQTLRTTTR